MKVQNKNNCSLRIVGFVEKMAFWLMLIATSITFFLVADSVLKNTWRHGDTIAAQGIFIFSYINVVALFVYLLCVAINFIHQQVILTRQKRYN